MNPKILALPSDERVEIIRHQVALVLPVCPGYEFEDETMMDAAELVVYFACHEYGVSRTSPIGRFWETEKLDAHHIIGGFIRQIEAGKNRQLVYRYRACQFFLNTWRP